MTRKTFIFITLVLMLSVIFPSSTWAMPDGANFDAVTSWTFLKSNTPTSLTPLQGGCNLPVTPSAVRQSDITGTGSTRTVTVRWSVNTSAKPSCVKIFRFNVRVRLFTTDVAQAVSGETTTSTGDATSATVTVNNVNFVPLRYVIEITGVVAVDPFAPAEEQGIMAGRGTTGNQQAAKAAPACGVNVTITNVSFSEITASSRRVRIQWAANMGSEGTSCIRHGPFNVKMEYRNDGPSREITVPRDARETTLTLNTSGLTISPDRIWLAKVHTNYDRTNEPDSPVFTATGGRTGTIE